MPRWRRGRSLLLLRRRAFILAALSAATLFLLLQHQGPKPPKPSSSPPAALAFSDEFSVEPPPTSAFSDELYVESRPAAVGLEEAAAGGGGAATCATVERMGEEAVSSGSTEAASLRVRELIQRHFLLHGAARVRSLPAFEFCKQGFVLGKASEAGFGNEMYKIFTAAALSVMLNRSLIIGQTRGLYPFGQYISYTDHSFTIGEIKHLWRKNRCAQTYGRDLNTRVDNFENPSETNVLCSDWNRWKDPIIWFDGTTDAVGIQFFLKNVHPEMKNAASTLFGSPGSFSARPNTFGELMRVTISPSQTVQKAVQWASKGSSPHIVLHMRMMANRPVRARTAAISCIQRAIQNSHLKGTPRVALISDTPSFVKEIKQEISEFAEVIYFDYKLFAKSFGLEMNGSDKPLDFRSRDWGSAPRWAAFVDFFLASSARYAVVTGAHRRVGTTYVQLTAALAAANGYGACLEPSSANFTFLSSIHSNLLVDGLSTQVGWGHIWNRFAGPLSCQHQPHQCALTPLLPHAWWDGQWQSPIARDVRRLLEYGVRIANTGEVDEKHLASHCESRKDHVKRYHVLPPDKRSARL
ncbi:uncharacterized protein LOC100841271 isoform X2 [Brachypodium distachyon]|uniref:uncharacterized protein LOC100841271 isoform X2 n=1 Tax=Brachypodium distachyon TaxID=15368 RepID=UPI00053001AA|nr:uncharacterized protein LOC100841271 isoform X2 [Brachypodium distachyon]|eukprot:XP_010237706.1 uncharacterized protein LOC100841271 isoform X2 [Brachypodium distachyon]